MDPSPTPENLMNVIIIDAITDTSKVKKRELSDGENAFGAILLLSVLTFVIVMGIIATFNCNDKKRRLR